MFSLHGTVTLHHVTALPPGTCPEQAISLLHDHDFLIRLDPEFAHVEALPRDEAAPAARRYKITDHMHALPRGLWDSTVAFEANMTNTEDGIL